MLQFGKSVILCINLLRNRQKRLKESIRDEAERIEFPVQVFLSPQRCSETLIAQLNAPINVANSVNSRFPQLEETQSLFRAFVPVCLNEISSEWMVLFFDSESNTISFVHPKYGRNILPHNNNIIPADTKAKIDNIATALRSFLLRRYNINTIVAVSNYTFQDYPLQQDDFNSYLYIFLLLYYLTVECPIYLLTMLNDTTTLRYVIFYAVCNNGTLPF